MKKLVLSLMLVFAQFAMGAGSTPISGGYLVNNFNLNSQEMTNGTYRGTFIGNVQATNIFTGVGTTGVVTATVGDLGKVLRANGDWVSLAGGGDFMSDGSVPMYGNLNLGGQGITNGFLKDSAGNTVVDWENELLFYGTNLMMEWNSGSLRNWIGVVTLDWVSSQLKTEGYLVSVDWATRQLSSSAGVTLDWENYVLNDSSGWTSVDWNSRFLQDDSGSGGFGSSRSSLDWNERQLIGTNGTNIVADWSTQRLYSSSNSIDVLSLDWANRQLIGTNGTDVIVDWSTISAFSNSVNAVVAEAGDFMADGSVPMSGNLNLGGQGITNGFLKDSAGNTIVDWESNILYDGTTSYSVDWLNRCLYSSDEYLSADWNQRGLYDSEEYLSLDWTERQLIGTNGTDVIVDWSTISAFSNSINAVVSGGTLLTYIDPYGTNVLSEALLGTGLSWDGTYINAQTNNKSTLLRDMEAGELTGEITLGTYLHYDGSFLSVTGLVAATDFSSFTNTVVLTNGTIPIVYLDVKAPAAAAANPASGYARLYAQTVNSQEALYYKQSDGTSYRICRDSVVTVYNAETNTLNLGEVVYCTSDMYGSTAHQVKRAKADDSATMPAFGIVTEAGGIASSNTGTIMSWGRTPTTMDTSLWVSGDILYVSPDTAGGLTIAEPTYPNYRQVMGYVGKVDAATGTISVRNHQASRPDATTLTRSYQFWSSSNSTVMVGARALKTLDYGTPPAPNSTNFLVISNNQYFASYCTLPAGITKVAGDSVIQVVANMKRSTADADNVSVWCELYRRQVNGTLDEIAATPSVQNLTGIAFDYVFSMSLAADFDMLATESLVVRFKSTLGAGYNVTVTIGAGYLYVPVPSSQFVLASVYDTHTALSVSDGAHGGIAPILATVRAPSAITYTGTNIATDASLANVYRVTLTNNAHLNAPTNLQDGQTVRWWVTQGTTGSHTLKLASMFVLPTGVTNLTLSTAVGSKDIIVGEYDSGSTKFRLTGLLYFGE